MKTNLHLDPISLRLPIVKHRILLQFYKRQTNECFFGVQFDGRFIMHADSISRKSLGKWAESDCERLPNVVKSCAEVHPLCKVFNRKEFSLCSSLGLASVL